MVSSVSSMIKSWKKIHQLFRCSIECLRWDSRPDIPGFQSKSTQLINHNRNVCCYNASPFWPGQNGRYLADIILKCIFLSENIWMSVKISLMIVCECPTDNEATLVWVLAWCRICDKPLYQQILNWFTEVHMCVTRSQQKIWRQFWCCFSASYSSVN